MPRSAPVPTDWQRIMALAADGLGWEDIVVIMRERARVLKYGPTWTPEQIRRYVLKRKH